MYYNFCRIHKTLRVTPAMEAGLTDHQWSIAELCGLIKPKKSTLSASLKEKERAMLLKALSGESAQHVKA
jgi:hypothetical protein